MTSAGFEPTIPASDRPQTRRVIMLIGCVSVKYSEGAREMKRCRGHFQGLTVVLVVSAASGLLTAVLSSTFLFTQILVDVGST